MLVGKTGARPPSYKGQPRRVLRSPVPQNTLHTLRRLLVFCSQTIVSLSPPLFPSSFPLSKLDAIYIYIYIFFFSFISFFPHSVQWWTPIPSLCTCFLPFWNVLSPDVHWSAFLRIRIWVFLDFPVQLSPLPTSVLFLLIFLALVSDTWVDT